ncbi:MAG: transcription-repair coupling factor, partial [Bacteroidales bacterium]|nr:transcription-repair coupling factor [Bacteroidales bacterium]
GSGNLLGAEQSGFIADVGYETYQKILNEALAELRESEPQLLEQEIRKSGKPQTTEKQKPYVTDFQIETDLEIMFPDEYVSNISERIRLYKELNEIDNEEGLELYESRLTDRFGPLPPPASSLLNVVRIKWIASRLGIEKILLKNNLLIAFFVSDPNSKFYRSSLFVSFMNYVNRHQKRMSVKQKESKLILTITGIENVRSSIGILQGIEDEAKRQISIG